MDKPERIALRCPQPHCSGEMEVSYPEDLSDSGEALTIYKIRCSWRCPVCDLRFLVSNPSALAQGTEYRLHRSRNIKLVKYSEQGHGLWLPKDV